MSIESIVNKLPDLISGMGLDKHQQLHIVANGKLYILISADGAVYRKALELFYEKFSK